MQGIIITIMHSGIVCDGGECQNGIVSDYPESESDHCVLARRCYVDHQRCKNSSHITQRSTYHPSSPKLFFSYTTCGARAGMSVFFFTKSSTPPASQTHLNVLVTALFTLLARPSFWWCSPWRLGLLRVRSYKLHSFSGCVNWRRALSPRVWRGRV